jgi:hypothetical protein
VGARPEGLLLGHDDRQAVGIARQQRRIRRDDETRVNRELLGVISHVPRWRRSAR